MEEIVDSPEVPQSLDRLPESKNSSPLLDFKQHHPINLWKDSPEKSDSGAEESQVNPPPPEELGEDECALLRGDAIGNTAYTQRWVLNTLMVITQALPHYLATDIELVEDAASVSQDDAGLKNMDTEDTAGKVKCSKASDEERPAVLELAEDVENAACQLWDMTVEPDVVQHLLNIGVVDILQLATDIITLSRAPRLTEIIIGVVANLCCQKEGCKKVIEHQPLLNACLALPHTTDDVPMLIESFRFLRLLLWHLTNRLPMNSRVDCHLIGALKGHEALKVALVFILKNSLSDTLLSSLMEFLEILLYLWLPDDLCYMAAHYAESGLVEGVVEVMCHFLKQSEKSGGHDLPKEVHNGILILYSFVGISASHLISSFDQYESLLEPILLRYVEHLAKVESAEELLEDETAERLTYALGLCELLVPTMRHPNILSSIGRLLALTHGHNHHYATPQGKHLQSTPNIYSDKKARRRLRRSRSRRRSRVSQEQMETESLSVSEHEPKEDGTSSIQRQDSKEEQERDEQEENTGSVGLARSLFQGINQNNSETSSTGLSEGKSARVSRESQGAAAASSNLREKQVIARTADNIVHKEKKDKSSTSAKLNSLVESLIDYCVRVVKYSRDLSTVLSALNECHVHEVQLFFRAVRSQDPKLVGDLQEKLLDTDSHNRLVTILSDMYT